MIQTTVVRAPATAAKSAGVRTGRLGALARSAQGFVFFALLASETVAEVFLNRAFHEATLCHLGSDVL